MPQQERLEQYRNLVTSHDRIAADGKPETVSYGGDLSRWFEAKGRNDDYVSRRMREVNDELALVLRIPIGDDAEMRWEKFAGQYWQDMSHWGTTTGKQYAYDRS